ncbi:MAG: carbohydrate-binding family 9-like protein [Candidatus Marinimicrobia bacterium]|nr:carbohydrate-binding family 9-like protein [Candidatus Neomarinimicrobiota bacterium]
MLFADFPTPQIKFNPERYVCYQTTGELVLDGKLDEADWKNAEWTQSFVDIEGELKPIPHFNTQVKMLWDETYFYVGVEMEEPHLWATLTERDDIIFRDNDFEIFIDPDGDSHNYMELEVNALGTEWDLLLLKPYRDQQKVAVDSWDIIGLKTVINLDGTLNDPSDIDKGWSIEIAIPWKVLEECAPKSIPEDGDQWRVNFSRVHWDLDVVDGKYQKLDKSEYNWVWSPQGLIAMHYPEMWGFVQFSTNKVGTQKYDFVWDTIEDHKWYMRTMYYKQKQYFDKHGEWMKDMMHLKNLTPYNRNFKQLPQIQLTHSGYEIIGEMKDGRIVIQHEDGLVKVK